MPRAIVKLRRVPFYCNQKDPIRAMEPKQRNRACRRSFLSVASLYTAHNQQANPLNALNVTLLFLGEGSIPMMVCSAEELPLLPSHL